MPKFHPLRPLDSAILVCEGKSDEALLKSIWKPFAPQIVVFDAGGNENVRLLAHILQPAVYICDRDFSRTYEQANQSLVQRKPATFWPRMDIEGYLVYEDWLLAAMKEIQASPKLDVQIMPQNEDEITQNLQTIAQRLVAEYAGRQTLHQLNYIAGPLSQYTAALSYFPDNPTDWEALLIQEAKRLANTGHNLSQKIDLTQNYVIQAYENSLEEYQNWALSVGRIRHQFSGKRLLKELCTLWQPENRGRKFGWETLRKLCTEAAQEYTQNVSGYLSNDPRLGDLGRLASKITGRTV